jgi:hypothetical protein
MFSNPYGGYNGRISMKGIDATLGAAYAAFGAYRHKHAKPVRDHKTPTKSEVRIGPDLRDDIKLGVSRHVGKCRVISRDTGNGNSFKRIVRSKFKKSRNELPYWRLRDMLLPPFKLKGTSYGNFTTSNVSVAETQYNPIGGADFGYAIPDSNIPRRYGSANGGFGSLQCSMTDGLPSKFGYGYQQSIQTNGNRWEQSYATANDARVIRWMPGMTIENALYPSDKSVLGVITPGDVVDCVCWFETCHMAYVNYNNNGSNMYNVSAIEQFANQSGRTPLYAFASSGNGTQFPIQPSQGDTGFDSGPLLYGPSVVGQQGGYQLGLDYQGGCTTHTFRNMLGSDCTFVIYECKPKKFLPSQVTPLNCLNTDIIEVQQNPNDVPITIETNASQLDIQGSNIVSTLQPDASGVSLAYGTGFGIYSPTVTIDKNCPVLLEFYNVGKGYTVKLKPDEEFEYVVNHAPFKYSDKYWLQSQNDPLKNFAYVNGGPGGQSVITHVNSLEQEFVYNEIDYLPFATTFLLIKAFGQSVTSRAPAANGFGAQVIPHGPFEVSHTQTETHYGRPNIPNLPKIEIQNTLCGNHAPLASTYIMNPLLDQQQNILA